MPDLDLSEEDFKTHWMLNPVEQESTDGNGHTVKHTDKRFCTSYGDYLKLREKGWHTISDVNDSHTVPTEKEGLSEFQETMEVEESDVDTDE
tara:strand:+ start:2429 stop:2704 length:276 start_codon:yes stop_codon:yes gene_type:complete